jgi:hypothetical protein
MKTAIALNKRFKICIFLSLMLLTVILNTPINAASMPLSQLSASQLYELAYNSANTKDYINAAIYLFAYTQLNPPEYANNANYRTSIDSNLALYLGEVNRLKNILRDVDNNLKSCGRYPCTGQSSGLGIVFGEVPLQPLQTPPDAAIVCTQPNYKGTCKILYVGDYTNFPNMGINDSVSSVMVGSRVKLTLYVHARFDSQYITFTSNDPDLSNNPIDSRYSWSKNASAARVQLK